MNYNIALDLKLVFYIIWNLHIRLIIVQRLLLGLVYPPLNSIFIIVLGCFLVKKYKRIGKLIIIIGTSTLYVQSTPFFAYHLRKSIELPPVNDIQMKKAQAIVVLGAGIVLHSHVYGVDAVPGNETLTRLKYAAYLAHKYPNLLIVTSGGHEGIYYTEGEVMRDTLKNRYHVNNPILVETTSNNTDENANTCCSNATTKRNNKSCSCITGIPYQTRMYAFS